MRRNKYIFVVIMLLAIAVAGGIFTTAYVKTEKEGKERDSIRVVTSFYPVYIAAKNVIGENDEVSLENLSEPQTGCMHDYQLTPQDMILLSKADVFLVNGGGMEGFLSETAREYPGLTIIQATDGLELLGQDKKEGHRGKEVYAREEGSAKKDQMPGHIHSGENAHAWLNTELYTQMVQNIAKGLSEKDPEHREEYQRNARQYCDKIQKLTDQIDSLSEELAGRKVIVFHEAYEYIAKQYGMEISYCLNLDEERQVSAGEVARVVEELQENQVSIVLAEEQYGKALGDTVEKEGQCRVYYPDSLVRGTYEKDSYLKGMQKNIDLMREIAGKE